MKTRIIYIAAFALAALSCTREVSTEIIPSSKQVTFTATWADSRDTKTAIQADGTTVWWTTDEQINAFYGTTFSGVFTSTNIAAAATVQFTGSLDVLAGAIEADSGHSKYWAVYPYDSSNTCDGQSVTLTVPSVQPAASGTFADKFFPAIATSTSLELAFYNVCGGARFSVSQTGINDIIIKSADGTPLAGRVKVGFSNDYKPAILSVEDGESMIHLKAPDGGFVPGEYYYAALLPATHAQGIQVGFNKSDGTGATKSIDKSLTVHRAIFGKLDNLDDGLTFTYGGGLTLGPQYGDGTEANPYNVAKACAVASSLNPGESIDDVYTKGVVSSIYRIDPDNEGLATYYIQDPGYDATLEAWKGFFLAGTKFTSTDQLKVGDEVIIKGRLEMYNNVQPEYAKRNKIVWLNGVKEYDAYPVSPSTLNASITVDNNSHISFNDGIVVAISALGFVVSNGEHNMHVFDSDYKKVSIGDNVLIDGIKTTYYGIPEMISSTATVISSGNALPRTQLIDISQTAGTYVARESDYLAITGIVSTEGSYIDFIMPGTDIRCSISNRPASFDLTPLMGKLATMYGYYCNFDPVRNAHQIIISSFEEAEPLQAP
jgi:hypothetical protein